MRKRFSVRNTGQQPFPIDMLRYDSCYPSSQEDAAEITHDLVPPPICGPDGITITLETTARNSPTPARWESFGWTVQDSLIPQQYVKNELDSLVVAPRRRYVNPKRSKEPSRPIPGPPAEAM